MTTPEVIPVPPHAAHLHDLVICARQFLPSAPTAALPAIVAAISWADAEYSRLMTPPTASPEKDSANG